MYASSALVSTLLMCLSVHPLADRTFDCGVQAYVTTDSIEIVYELGLSELTLATELLALSEPGETPMDAEAAIDRYRDLMREILARGLILVVEGSESRVLPGETSWRRVEDHLAIEFAFRAELADGRGERTVELFDTNLTGERGFRRMALDVRDGVELIASDAARDLDSVPRIPIWEMTLEQEDSATRLKVTFRTPGKNDSLAKRSRGPKENGGLSSPRPSTARRREPADGWAGPLSLSAVLTALVIAGAALGLRARRGKAPPDP